MSLNEGDAFHGNMGPEMVDPERLVPSFVIGKIHGSPSLPEYKAPEETPGTTTDSHTPESTFPWEKLVASNFSTQEFRQILLSSKFLVPVTVIETEDHLMVKFECRSKPPQSTPITSPKSEKLQEYNSTTFKSATSLIASTFFNGVMKWIIGN